MAAISEILAREPGCAQAYVENIITLLDEGNTCLLYTSRCV